MSRGAMLQEVAARIDAIRAGHPARVAIDGVDASGKTTLADELALVLRGRGREVIRASVDGFHHPRAARVARGELSPEGYYRDSFNYTAMVEALIEPLGPGGSRQYRARCFDHLTDSAVISCSAVAAENAVLLFDGVFLLRPELRRYWDFAIFVSAVFETTLRRALRRDMAMMGSEEAVRRRYLARYIPGQQMYMEEAQPQVHADVTIGNDVPESPVLTWRQKQP